MKERATVGISMNAEEKERIAKKANAVGLSVSAYIRFILKKYEKDVFGE